MAETQILAVQLLRPMVRCFRFGRQNEVKSLIERQTELFKTATAPRGQLAAQSSTEEKVGARAMIFQMDIQSRRKAEILVVLAAIKMVEFLNTFGEIDLFRS